VLLGAAIMAARLQQRDGALPVMPTLVVAIAFVGCLRVFLRAKGEGRLAVLALTLVMAQGLVGGLTVVYRLAPTVLVLHLATSMLFLATVLTLAWRLWLPGVSLGPRRTPLLWVTAGVAYFQILLGAAVRHTGAGLVCVDLPYCRGAIWPTGVHP